MIRNSNNPCDVFLDLSALLRTKFAFWFPLFSTRIRMEDLRLLAQKMCVCLRGIHVHPRGRSASFRTTICGCLRGTTTEFLGKS